MDKIEKIKLVQSDLQILRTRLECLKKADQLDWLDSLLEPIIESEIENNERFLRHLNGDETVDMKDVALIQHINFAQLSWLTKLYHKEGRYPFPKKKEESNAKTN